MVEDEVVNNGGGSAAADSGYSNSGIVAAVMGTFDGCGIV